MIALLVQRPLAIGVPLPDSTPLPSPRTLTQTPNYSLTSYTRYCNLASVAWCLGCKDDDTSKGRWLPAYDCAQLALFGWCTEPKYIYMKNRCKLPCGSDSCNQGPDTCEHVLVDGNSRFSGLYAINSTSALYTLVLGPERHFEVTPGALATKIFLYQYYNYWLFDSEPKSTSGRTAIVAVVQDATVENAEDLDGYTTTDGIHIKARCQRASCSDSKGTGSSSPVSDEECAQCNSNNWGSLVQSCGPCKGWACAW